MDYDEVVADLKAKIEPGHNYIFISRSWLLLSLRNPAATAVYYCRVVDKDRRKELCLCWQGQRLPLAESEMVKHLGKEKTASTGCYDAMVDAAVADISQYGDFEWFVSDDLYESGRWPPPLVRRGALWR